uniref:CSON013765 protein n=1 Tax=Culicoides sonorensis TaxID=179676 RepID=A0A336KTD2_CULSO
MAAFVTNIQPSLLESNQGHIPHHHQSAGHSSHLPHSGHNLPSPPTTHGHQHHGMQQQHGHGHGHGARTPIKEHHTPLESHIPHHPPQHYEDFALIHHQYAGGEILSPPHGHSPAHPASGKDQKHSKDGNHHHHHHHHGHTLNFLPLR